MNIFLLKEKSKSLGQVFLKNSVIIEKIISIIEPKKKDFLIEIGPGFGAMTNHLVKYINNKLILLEIDEKLVFWLSNKFFNKKIKLILSNAITFNYKYFFSQNTGIYFRLVGNLPYNISVTLLISLLKYKENILDMHFMFQKEVANRILACVGSKSYGRLSVIVQSFFMVYNKLYINKYNFYPIPKVNSVFLKFVPLPVNNNINYQKIFLAIKYITKIAFNNRRKILKHKFNHVFKKNIWTQLDINPLLRAENISVKQYLSLAYFLMDYKL